MNDQKTISIKEALGFPEQTPIPRILGKLVKLGDRTEGEGDYGKYTKQWGIIRDGDDSILFTAWKQKAIPQEHVGKTLIFRSGKGKKPTMKLESDFKDKTKRTLKVTESCHVLTEEEDTDDIPMDYPTNTPKSMDAIAGSMMAEGLKNPPQANVAPKKAIPKNGVQEVRHRVMQLANLREICDHAASFLYPDTSCVGIEYVKDIATSLFIQAARENLHDKLPNNKPLSKKDDVEASENLEEKEDEIF